MVSSMGNRALKRRIASLRLRIAEHELKIEQTGTDLFIVSSFLLPCGCLTLPCLFAIVWTEVGYADDQHVLRDYY
jgi:hypothetical protein